MTKITEKQIIYGTVTESVDKNTSRRIQVITGYCHPELNIQEDGYSIEWRYFNTIERAKMFIEMHLTTFYAYNHARAFIFIDGKNKPSYVYKLVGSINDPGVKQTREFKNFPLVSIKHNINMILK